MTGEKLEDFLADLCFADWQDLPAGLEKLGLKSKFIEKSGTIVIRGGAFPCGFSHQEDPQGRAIQISMAVAGARASSHLPNLLLKVNQRRSAALRAKS